jgi:molybdate transport system ATP-binding protein
VWGAVPERGLRVDIQQGAPIPLNVAFHCEPGQVLALFGPSGSGKTTVLRTIAGLYAPRQAHVAVDGETWLDTAGGLNVAAHTRRVGFVFQEYALFPHLSALNNVVMALGHRPRGERRERALELLQLVHLHERVDRRPGSLSGGERQRVAVARALAREPRVLLFDEPFAAVDRSLRRALQSEIDGIRRTVDIPIVLVTHDYEDVVRLATHLAIIRAGQVIAHGSLTSLTSRPDLPWLREAVGLGAVVDATVVRVDATRRLAELDIGGSVLLAPQAGLTAGGHVRVRIPAREVILATEAPSGLSVHNVLTGTVASVAVDGTSEAAIVQLAVGRTRILAEVTRDAVSRLGIVKGMQLQALIKSVSLEVLSTTPAPEDAIT